MLLRDLLFQKPDIEQTQHPKSLIRAGVIGIGVLIGLLLIWSALAPLSGAAIGAGIVKVDLERKVVEHQEGGMVGEILVRNGSHVQAGQPLIILKDIRVDASNEAMRTQLDAELAKAARLEAEQFNQDQITFPAELMQRADDPRIHQLILREQALFKARTDSLNNQITLLHKEIQEARSEVHLRTTQLKADDVTVDMSRQEVNANEALVEKGFVSKTKLFSLKRDGGQIASRRAENAAEMSRTLQKIADLELRAETLRSNFMQDASNQLRQSTSNILDLRERLRPVQDAQERQRIVAPIAGEVVDLKVSTIGATIGPREPIMEIVPQNPHLVIEAKMRPEDINSLKTGAKADVRLTAFRQRITPTVAGVVSYVSADRLTDKTNNAAYYLVTVNVTPSALKKAGNLHLQAGMPAEVFIKTEERSALSYLMNPVVGFLQHALREP